MPMKQSAYIFDVDGVLNNLKVYQPDERIIARMAELLDEGTFVAINTGRGYEWIEENVSQALREKVRDTSSLSRLFVAAEMGGIGVEYPDGEEQKNPSAFSLTPDQIAKVRQTFEEYPEYIDRVHWYAKESMATLDKNENASMEEFRPAQKKLTAILEKVFEGQHVKVANSNDAIDVYAPEAGKWAGAQLIYEWLRRTSDIQHDHFVCFGDSIVDYQMARFFAAQSHDTVFVFTGPATLTGIEADDNITLVKTDRPYHEGTYDYLAA
jgi:HAD superfamily hydrolase (TIGR01484 family)